MKKKLVIVLLGLIVITFASTGIILKIVSNKHVTNIEKILNDNLVEMEEVFIKYDKFKCKGFLSVKCESPNISLAGADQAVLRDIKMNFVPRSKNFKFDLDFNYDYKNFKNNNTTIKSNFKLNSNTGQIDGNFVTSSLHNGLKTGATINSNFENSDYLKDKNFFKLIKEFNENGSENFFEKLFGSNDIRVGLGFYKIYFESDNLSNSLVNLYNETLQSKINGNNITKEDAIFAISILIEALKNQGSVKDINNKLTDDLVIALENINKVLRNESNYLLVEATNKEKDNTKHLISLSNPNIDKLMDMYEIKSSINK